MTLDVVQRRRIEVLVDRPLAPLLAELARDSGITSYSLLPVLGGAGHNGAWTDEEISGAQAKLIFLTVASVEKTDRLVEQLAPLLDSHGLVLFLSTVDVVRGARF
jgi:hypothetical protein